MTEPVLLLAARCSCTAAFASRRMHIRQVLDIAGMQLEGGLIDKYVQSAELLDRLLNRRLQNAESFTSR